MLSSNRATSKLADAAWKDMERVAQSGNLGEFQRLCFLVECSSLSLESDGWGALGYAVFHGQLDMVRWWIEDYAPENKTWAVDGLIRQAIRGRSCVEMLSLLHQSGCPLSGRDDRGKTLLHQAAWLGDEAASYFLLQAGASPMEADDQGWTALRWAIRGGHVDVVDVLMRFHADPCAICCLGLQDAIFAQSCGHDIMVEKFRPFVEHDILSKDTIDKDKGEASVRRL